MPSSGLDPAVLAWIAERFKVLAEPARLRILQALREGEKTVTELLAATGLSQPNLSRHLQRLHAAGFVERRRNGVHVRYRLAGDDVFLLCDIMCTRLEAEVRQREARLRAAGRGRRS